MDACLRRQAVGEGMQLERDGQNFRYQHGTKNSCRSANDPIAVIVDLAITLSMRSHPTNIIAAMLEMLTVFKGVCKDVETLDRLMQMASDRGKWAGGHSLFSDIRQKTLRADEQGDSLEIAQYAFE